MSMKHYAPNRCLYIKVAKLTLYNRSLGWGVQRCQTYKIALSKYSKSTAGILQLKKRGGGGGGEGGPTWGENELRLDGIVQFKKKHTHKKHEGWWLGGVGP